VVMCEVGIPSVFCVSLGFCVCLGTFCCGCRIYRGSCGVESFVHNLEGEASGKRLLDRPRKISFYRIFSPRQDYTRW
jgi:hypothetical protein